MTEELASDRILTLEMENRALQEALKLKTKECEDVTQALESLKPHMRNLNRELELTQVRCQAQAESIRGSLTYESRLEEAFQRLGYGLKPECLGSLYCGPNAPCGPCFVWQAMEAMREWVRKKTDPQLRRG